MRSLKECTTSYLWDLYNNNKQILERLKRSENDYYTSPEIGTTAQRIKNILTEINDRKSTV
jgi:hypothetical protein